MIARTAKPRACCWVMVLAGAVSSLSGCAALNPGPQCHCPKCQQQYLDDQQVLIDFQEGFRKYVLGTEFEEDTPQRRPRRRPQHSKIAQRTSKPAEKSPIRKVSNTAEFEAAGKLEVAQTPLPPAQPIPPSIPNAAAAPAEAVAPAACEMAMCPPMGDPGVVAPPPRFFPVPARPVFSPQPLPFGYPATGQLEPTPMSNWGESTDASL